MNTQNFQTICAIIVFCGIIGGSLAIKCFDCNSYEDSRCNNPSNDTLWEKVKECDMCRKIEQEFEMDGKMVTRIQRQCATRGEVGECLERTGTKKFKSWYCHCNNKDFCNKATVTSGSFTSMAGVLLLALYSLIKCL